MCAGTPRCADQSCFARQSETSGSASGTTIDERAFGHSGGQYARRREHRSRADPVAPEGVVAARARDLPEPALGLRRASRRLGRSGGGATGARARDHHPRRDRRRPDDLSRGPSARRLRFDGWNVAVWAFLGGLVYGTVAYWLGGLLVHALASALRSGSSYRQARHLLAFAAAPLALSLVLVWPVRHRDLRRRPLPDRRLRRRDRRVDLRRADPRELRLDVRARRPRAAGAPEALELLLRHLVGVLVLGEGAGAHLVRVRLERVADLP